MPELWGAPTLRNAVLSRLQPSGEGGEVLVTKQSSEDIGHWLWRGALNLLWLLITLVLLMAVSWIWPHKSWQWGLLIGAGAGGGAVFIVAVIIDSMGVARGV